MTRFLSAVTAASTAVLLAASLAPTASAASIPVLDKAAQAPVAPQDTPDKPDIVVIYSDDQSKGTEKFMPQVQRLLAKQGVSFTDAHTPTSTCCPSRVSLLTGQLANKTGVWTNWPPYGGFEAFMTEVGDTDTIATRLDAQGYRTALVGKYLNGYASAANRLRYARDAHYIPPGWDEWYAYAGPRSVRNPENSAYYDYWTMSSSAGAAPRYEFHGRDADDYSTRVFGTRVREIIRSTPQDQPLFMLFTPNAPHAKYYPDPVDANYLVADAEPVAGFNDVTGKPPWLQRRGEVSEKKAKKIREDQIRAAIGLDRTVAEIISELERRGTLSNTLLVFASDNGYTWGEYRLLGTKNLPYTTQVPMIMRWDDGGFAGGVRDSRLSANIDITRTVLAAAGASTEGLTDALDLADPKAKRKSLVISAWRDRGDPFTRVPAYCGVRTGNWLYIRYSKGRFEELYDVRRDPHMLVNLSGDASVAVHEEALEETTRRECSPVPPGFTWSK